MSFFNAKAWYTWSSMWNRERVFSQHKLVQGKLWKKAHVKHAGRVTGEHVVGTLELFESSLRVSGEHVVGILELFES